MRENVRNNIKRVLAAVMLTMSCAVAMAQERTVQNRPYTDLRTLHFGILVGTHFQDMEFVNVGPQTLTADDGTQYEANIGTDQDRWDAGLTVGVLGELRLSQTFQLRIAPAMYFGTRHFTFHNQNPVVSESGEQRYTEQRQTMKVAYVSTAAEMIVAAPRTGNHRPYALVGVNPMINLSSRDNDYLKLKRYDAFLEIGAGCDFYLPFFKLRPELKFMLGLTDCLDKKHADNLRNNAMQSYARSVSEAHSKMIALTFYFE